MAIKETLVKESPFPNIFIKPMPTAKKKTFTGSMLKFRTPIAFKTKIAISMIIKFLNIQLLLFCF